MRAAQCAHPAALRPRSLHERSRVHTPFGGARLYPLQAAVCAPLEAGTQLLIARRLLDLGASPNVAWRDCSGRHTPLSQALVQRHPRLAELLVERGAGALLAAAARRFPLGGKRRGRCRGARPRGAAEAWHA